MPDVNFDQLPDAGALSGTEVVPVNKAGVTLQTTTGDIAGLVPNELPSSDQGDIFYASAVDTVTTLAKDATATRYLANTGADNNPNWAQVNLTNGVTGALPIANGGTNLTTYAQGDILYSSAADTLAKLAKDVSATRYLTNTGASNAPAWGQVNLANGVTGTLPIANGGTGQVTANAALNALLPDQAAANGLFLQSDGVDTAWAAPLQDVTFLAAVPPLTFTGDDGGILVDLSVAETTQVGDVLHFVANGTFLQNEVGGVGLIIFASLNGTNIMGGVDTIDISTNADGIWSCEFTATVVAGPLISVGGNFTANTASQTIVPEAAFIANSGVSLTDPVTVRLGFDWDGVMGNNFAVLSGFLTRMR